MTKNKDLPESAKNDMKIALITLKYTQSNSVCYVKNGQAIGIGAGQQSHVYIGDEYEDVLREGEWQKRFKVKPPVFTREEKRAWLDGNTDVTLGSDAFFPFSDNVERAKKSGVKYIAQPGGSVRDDLVIECADKYDMVMAFTGIRLFHH